MSVLQQRAPGPSLSQLEPHRPGEQEVSSVVGCWRRAGPEESQGPEAKLQGVLREQWVNATPSQLEQRFGVNCKIKESISGAVPGTRKLRGDDQISRRLRAAPEGSHEQGGVGVCEGVGCRCLPKTGLTG